MYVLWTHENSVDFDFMVLFIYKSGATESPRAIVQFKK